MSVSVFRCLGDCEGDNSTIFAIAIIIDEHYTLDKTRSSTHINNPPVCRDKKERKQNQQRKVIMEQKKAIMKLGRKSSATRHVNFCIPHWYGVILNLQPDPQAQANALLGVEQPS